MLALLKDFGLDFATSILHQTLKGYSEIHSRDNALNFHKIRDVCILLMVLDVWSYNPERNSENKPPPCLITKQHYILGLKKITGDFFQTDNQPTVGTNVTRDTQAAFATWFIVHIGYTNVPYYHLNNKLETDSIWPWPIRL